MAKLKNANIHRAVSKSMRRSREDYFRIQHDLSLHNDGNNVEYNYEKCK